VDILLFVTSFFEATDISILEAIMLICFGISWPVSVLKALMTKIVVGKSPLFMSLVAIGYVSGISHKIMYSRDYLVVLYMFNLSMILIDLYLYTRYNLEGTAGRTVHAGNSDESGTFRYPITVKPDLR
jgi:hypothetical protein